MKLRPFALTGAGSLPFLDPDEARIHVALRYGDLPFVPELPRRPDEPAMIAGMWRPGDAEAVEGGEALLISAPEDAVQWMETAAPTEVPRVRTHLERLPAAPLGTVAMHLPGPVTLLRATTHPTAKGGLFAQPKIRDAAGAFIARCGAALSEEARRTGRTALVVLDEPLLAAPAVDVDNPAHRLLLGALIDVVQRAGGRVGLHSCGDPPVDLLLHLDFDFVHFDAVAHGAALAKRKRTLDRYLRRGGLLALGVFDARAAKHDVAEARARLESIREGGGEGIFLAPSCGSGRATIPEELALADALERLRRNLVEE